MSFIMLPLIAFTITKVIGGSIPLALGMVGALSIVRFRHPVRNAFELVMYFALITIGITASVKIRAYRRFKELKKLKKGIKYENILKSIKKRDKSDYNRKISPLKKTKDSVLINTTNLSKRACFLKIKKIIDKKIK